MTATDLLTFLLTGAFAPLLIAVVNRPEWSGLVRQLVALVVSIVGAVGMILATGGFDAGTDTATKIVLVVSLASLAYNAMWKPTGVTPAIEKATEPI